MTKISLKVGESYRHVSPIYGVTKMISASFEVFDTSGEAEFPDKEIVFFGDDGIRYRDDGSHWNPQFVISEQVECDGPLEEEPDFQLEVGKTYKHNEYSKNVTIVRQWLLEDDVVIYTLFMGDDGHIYWGTGINAVFPSSGKYNLIKEVL